MIALVQLVLGLLPASRAKNWALSRTSRLWSVHPSAVIAPTVFLGVRELHVGQDVRVGLLNRFRSLRAVRLGDRVMIGHLNRISGGSPDIDPTDVAGTFTLGRGSHVVLRHEFDCSGGVVVGDLTLLSGSRSLFLTHHIDPMAWTQLSAPLVIGDHCLFGSRVVVTRGLSVTDRVVVGAGSVVTRDLDESEHLYGGQPARPIRSMAGARLFTTDDLFLEPPDPGRVERP